MRLIRDAPAATVRAAARDHARVVQDRIDAVWLAQADNLADPKAAAAALRAAELELRTFLPVMGVQSQGGSLTVLVDPALISGPTMIPGDTLESYNARCREVGASEWPSDDPDRPFPLLRSVG